MALTQISTAGVKDDAVTSGKIPANAVGSSELADNAVDTAAIANNAVTEAKIANSAVSTNQLADTGVSAAKLANDAVTTAKIVDEAVTLAKLEHGTSSNNGKFLRANNGADPSFETVNTDLVADTSPQLGGPLDANGEHITIQDSPGGTTNSRLKIGNGDDLQIFHNGTNSIISNGTGDLSIRSGNNIVFMDNTADETLAKFVDNGACELYHDNTKKFETTSTGATVTGTIVADNAIGRNILINGSMRVAQRATSKSMSNHGSTYDVCDRWIYNRHGVTADIAQVDEAPAGSGFTKSFKWTSTSAVTSIAAGNMLKFIQRIECQDIKRLGYGNSDAKTATLSFWIRGSLTGKVGINCARDSRTFSTQVNYDTANTWRFFEVIIPADTSTGFSANNNDAGFDLSIAWGAGSNFTSGTTNGWQSFHTAYASGFTASEQGAYLTTNGSTFQITGVQFEIGNKATAFEHLPYSDELIRCQRYYEVIKGPSVTSAGETLIAVGHVYQSQRVLGNWQFKAEKRAAPSVSTDDVAEVQALKSDGSWYSAGGFGGNSNPYATRLDLTSMPSSPMTEGQAAEIRLTGDGRIHFSSEL